MLRMAHGGLPGLICLALTAIAVGGAAAAAEVVRIEEIPNPDRLSVSRDDRVVDEPALPERKAESGPPSAIRWIASLGLAYIDTESGNRIYLTPFELVGRLNSKTSIKIEGDGFGYSRSDEGNTHGFNNVTFVLSRTVFRDDASRLRLGAGFTVPGAKGFGSSSSKLRLSASYTLKLREGWDMLAYAKLNRRNRAPAPGESRFEQIGLLQAGYTFADAPKAGVVSHALLFHVERDYRAGVGGASLAGLTYEFPIASNLGGTVVFTRGITPGARDNTVEFLLSFGF